MYSFLHNKHLAEFNPGQLNVKKGLSQDLFMKINIY